MAIKKPLTTKTGSNKVVMIISIICVASIIAISLFIFLPKANPIVVYGTINRYMGVGSVSIIFDDGSLYYFRFCTYSIHQEPPEDKFTLWEDGDNEVSTSKIKEIAKLLDAPVIFEESRNYSITFSRYDKLNDTELSNILNAIGSSNYTEFEPYYSGGGLDLSNDYLRIWDGQDSFLTGEYGSDPETPDTYKEIIKRIYEPVNERWPY